MPSPSTSFDAAYFKDLLGRLGFSVEVQDLQEGAVLVIPPEGNGRVGAPSPTNRLYRIIRSLVGSNAEITTVPAGLLVRIYQSSKF